LLPKLNRLSAPTAAFADHGESKKPMPSFDELSFSVTDFAGTVRLFPLPNLVLFPHVMQPLHIFEPRYRSLMEDALATDRLIAMAVLEPGWENDYEGRPRLCTTACLGRVTSYHRFDDGTYNLLLLGLRRVKLIRELGLDQFNAVKLYREAEVELCEDLYPADAEPGNRELQKKLREAFVRLLPLIPEAHEQVDQLMASDIPLGMLTDVISFMLKIGIRQKEALLGELNVYRRADMLLEHLRTAGLGNENRPCAAHEFPPRFSLN
jgi:Lon protease-like protein